MMSEETVLILSAAAQESWDNRAQAFLEGQHGPDWYIGNASKREWDAAYEATKPGCAGARDFGPCSMPAGHDGPHYFLRP